jgi:hypothetical protein
VRNKQDVGPSGDDRGRTERRWSLAENARKGEAEVVPVRRVVMRTLTFKGRLRATAWYRFVVGNLEGVERKAKEAKAHERKEEERGHGAILRYLSMRPVRVYLYVRGQVR